MHFSYHYYHTEEGKEKPQCTTVGRIQIIENNKKEIIEKLLSSVFKSILCDGKVSILLFSYRHFRLILTYFNKFLLEITDCFVVLKNFLKRKGDKSKLSAHILRYFEVIGPTSL